MWLNVVCALVELETANIYIEKAVNTNGSVEAICST